MFIDALNHGQCAAVSKMINDGSITAREACIAALNAAESDTFGSFITITASEALSAAEKVDKNIAEGNYLPLAGVPLAIKDNICTAGIRTTCASKMLESYIPSHSSTVYERLISAGCLPIGKTNMDEFAMGSEGTHSYFGSTCNPIRPGSITGGSSSGSAAAVAAGIVPAALGSDTGGSSRQPAALCSLVSMKPTYGRVSRWGLVEFAPSMDQICPITRTVQDNALILSEMEGSDPRDSSMRNTLESINPKPAAECPKKVGAFIPSGCSGSVIDALKQAVSLLLETGAECTEAELPHQDYAVCVYYTLSSAEALSCLARYDGIRFGTDSHITDEKNNFDVYGLRSRYLGEEVKRRLAFGAAALSHDGANPYRAATELREKITEKTDSLFEKHDVIIMPTTKKNSYETGEYDSEVGSCLTTVYANLTGCPAISLPFAGSSIQLMAARGQDNVLYRTARFLEENRYD